MPLQSHDSTNSKDAKHPPWQTRPQMKTDSAHHGPLASSLSQLALVWGITEEPSAQHVPLSEVVPLPRSVPIALPFRGIPRVTCVSQGHVHTHTHKIFRNALKFSGPELLCLGVARGNAANILQGFARESLFFYLLKWMVSTMLSFYWCGGII